MERTKRRIALMRVIMSKIRTGQQLTDEILIDGCRQTISAAQLHNRSVQGFEFQPLASFVVLEHGGSRAVRIGSEPLENSLSLVRPERRAVRLRNGKSFGKDTLGPVPIQRFGENLQAATRQSSERI